LDISATEPISASRETLVTLPTGPARESGVAAGAARGHTVAVSGDTRAARAVGAQVLRDRGRASGRCAFATTGEGLRANRVGRGGTKSLREAGGIDGHTGGCRTLVRTIAVEEIVAGGGAVAPLGAGVIRLAEDFQARVETEVWRDREPAIRVHEALDAGAVPADRVRACAGRVAGCGLRRHAALLCGIARRACRAIDGLVGGSAGSIALRERRAVGGARREGAGGANLGGHAVAALAALACGAVRVLELTVDAAAALAVHAAGCGIGRAGVAARAARIAAIGAAVLVAEGAVVAALDVAVHALRPIRHRAALAAIGAAAVVGALVAVVAVDGGAGAAVVAGRELIAVALAGAAAVVADGAARSAAQLAAGRDLARAVGADLEGAGGRITGRAIGDGRELATGARIAGVVRAGVAVVAVGGLAADAVVVLAALDAVAGVAVTAAGGSAEEAVDAAADLAVADALGAVA